MFCAKAPCVEVTVAFQLSVRCKLSCFTSEISVLNSCALKSYKKKKGKVWGKFGYGLKKKKKY